MYYYIDVIELTANNNYSRLIGQVPGKVSQNCRQMQRQDKLRTDGNNYNTNTTVIRPIQFVEVSYRIHKLKQKWRNGIHFYN